jgi:hypothetical protein
MTSSVTPNDRPDQALVHHFIRVFGRRPAPAELKHYQRPRSRLALRLPARARRRVAQLIVRM